MASFSFMMKGSAPSILTSVSDHFFLEVHRNDLAILAARARTQSNDVAPLRLLGDSVSDDGASGGVGFAVDAAQGHVIVQGRNLMVLLQCLGCRL